MTTTILVAISVILTVLVGRSCYLFFQGKKEDRAIAKKKQILESLESKSKPKEPPKADVPPEEKEKPSDKRTPMSRAAAMVAIMVSKTI